MIRIGTITGREVAKNRDGESNRLMLQVQISDSDDIQTVELLNAQGEDNNPIDGAQVVIVDLGSAFKVAIATNDGIAPSMTVGEKKVYSIDGAGDISAFINYLSNGIIELNGNDDFAVRFSALEAAFNQLKDDVDAHTHLYTPGAGTPTQTGTPPASTADISGAKIDNIKVPLP